LGSTGISEFFMHAPDKPHGVTVSPVSAKTLSSLPADRLVLTSIEFLMKLPHSGFG
jgi:hypothetical protein